MLFPFLLVVCACLFWGFVFVVPSWVSGFSPVEIASGRFFVYGFVCTAWTLCKKRHLFKLPFSLWRKAAFYGACSTVLCYTTSVFAMRLSNPAIATLIFAMSPLAVAFFGNLHTREYPFNIFILPSLCLVVGLTIANFEAFEHMGENSLSYVLGLFLAFVSLAFWTYYAVFNSEYLSKQKELSTSDWSAMMGTAIFVVIALYSAIALGFSEDPQRYFSFKDESFRFVFSSLFLGIFITALAFYFWNLGSEKLSISLMGQLMMLEIIFGLTLIFLFEQRLPSRAESIGIFFLVSGVLIGSRALLKREEKQPL